MLLLSKLWHDDGVLVIVVGILIVLAVAMIYIAERGL